MHWRQILPGVAIFTTLSGCAAMNEQEYLVTD